MQFDNKVVGCVIKELRNQKGMTQELLSGFAGIARSHLAMIETGSKQANFETLRGCGKNIYYISTLNVFSK